MVISFWPRLSRSLVHLPPSAVAAVNAAAVWMSLSGQLAGGGLARALSISRRGSQKEARRRTTERSQQRPGPVTGKRFHDGAFVQGRRARHQEDLRGSRAPPSGGSVLEDWHAPRRSSGKLRSPKILLEVGLSKTARAKQRMMEVPPAERVKARGLTYLEKASLRRTLPRYEALWDDFATFAQKRGAKLRRVEEIDETGADFLNAKFFDGELPDLSGYLVATIRKFKPEVVRAGRGALAKTMAAARGFRNLCPAQTKQPLPWEAACLIAQQMCHSGLPTMGLAVVFAFAMYLRPSEMLLCKACQLSPPIRGGGAAHKSWSLILHPSERGQRSKVGMADEAMRIEGDEFKFLGVILRRWLRGKSKEEFLFEFSYAAFNREFRRAGETAGLGALGPPTLHQLRHGGASTDAASGKKGLPEIQAKGRWSDPRSVRRYAKGGRVTQQLWLLTPGGRKKCFAAARGIGATLSTSLWPSRKPTDLAP